MAHLSRRIIAVLLLGLALSALTGSAAYVPAAYVPPPPTLQVKAPLAHVAVTLQAQLAPAPEAMPTYRVLYPRADAERLARLAAAFGLDERARADAGGLLLRQGALSLEVYPQTGAFWFADSSQLWRGDGSAAPPEEEAGVALAQAFLAAQGLLPEQMLFEGTGHSELTIYDVASGESKVVQTDLHVNYRMNVDGIPVAGPGGKIKVYLGPGNRIVGLYWAGFSLRPHRPCPVISPQEALSLLERDGIATTVQAPQRATVAKVGLVYLAGPGTEAQEYLEPAYRFEGQVQGAGEAQPFVQYVPAIPGRTLKQGGSPAASERTP